jgi:hypothetical protein
MCLTKGVWDNISIWELEYKEKGYLPLREIENEYAISYEDFISQGYLELGTNTASFTGFNITEKGMAYLIDSRIRDIWCSPELIKKMVSDKAISMVLSQSFD